MGTPFCLLAVPYNGSYAGPNLTRTIIPDAALFRPAPTARLVAGMQTRLSSIEAMLLYPNPARNQITVSVQASANEEIQVEVLDALARRVAGTTHRATAGWNDVRLQLSQLPGGVYTVTVQRATERTVRRLIVE